MEMRPAPDFKELLELFNARGVEYLIVGGFAMAHHGAPRATGDLDLWVCPATENARRALSALDDFGFASLGLKPSDLTKPETVVQLGDPPVRIDIISSIDGVTWDQAKQGQSLGDFGGMKAPYLGRREFIANKRATGRKKDLADIEVLEQE
jgi:hypothetical protein